MHQIRSVGLRRAVWITELLAVAVIGGDEEFAVELESFLDHLADAIVDFFDRFDAGLDVASVQGL